MQLGLIIILAFTLGGCATTYIKPSTVQNPAPAEKFSAFEYFELKRVSLDSAYTTHNVNQRAAARIQEHFDQRYRP